MFETVLDYIARTNPLIIDYIARTNLFNFIIFASIFALIFWKIDLIGGLEKGRQAVAEKIEDSETKKEEAETGLKTIEDKVSNLENEIDELVKKSEENANLVGEKIITDANKTAENIKTGTAKLTENKAALLKNDIMRRASLAAVETAKNHIINELMKNHDLHNKLIDESIEAINNGNI